MDQRRLFVLSEEALARVLDQVHGDQWQQVRPAWFEARGTATTTLRDFVNYHAQDSAWVPDVLAGRTAEEVGAAHEGDLLGSDPAAGYRRVSRQAADAATALEDPERLVHLSYGDFPAGEYLVHVASFRGFRAYDFARWIGVDTTLDDELVQGLWEEVAPHADMWRSLGVYRPAVSVAPDAPLQDRLLGLVGRDPHPDGGQPPG